MAENSLDRVRDTFHQPLATLIRKASQIHGENFPHNEIQASSLLSVKTGGCPENCSYCPQSAHYQTGVQKTGVMEKEAVVEAARKAKDQGASRFCMGAAWRSVREGKEFDQVVDLVRAVRAEGLEVCCTLGMLSESQARRLKEAGLYAYNHNLDTSREYYSKIIQTRTYDDRLNTIQNVRSAGLTVCTGGILGMGESEEDRISFINELLSLKPVPESITINTLVPFDGTPLEDAQPIPTFDLLRVVATLRILAPKSMIRLSAGRLSMSQEAQLLCFVCGANSIFLGDKLLTSPNPKTSDDQQLMETLGYSFKVPDEVQI